MTRPKRSRALGGRAAVTARRSTLRRGLADLQGLAAAQIGIAQGQLRAVRAVGRIEVGDPELLADDLERQVPSRNAGVAQAHRARRTLADEHGRGLVVVDGELRAGVGPVDHDEDEGAGTGLRLARMDLGRSLLEIGEVVLYHGRSISRRVSAVPDAPPCGHGAGVAKSAGTGAVSQGAIFAAGVVAACSAR